MTREEAIASYEKLYAYMVEDDDAIELDYGEFMELNQYIRTALRPVSREQVEKAWRGEWIDAYPGTSSCKCTKCGAVQEYESTFCCHCGAPMTDEAVDMVMERMKNNGLL